MVEFEIDTLRTMVARENPELYEAGTVVDVKQR